MVTEDPRHKAHEDLQSLTEFEIDNGIENLILILGIDRVREAFNQATGEQTLLSLCGKELE